MQTTDPNALDVVKLARIHAMTGTLVDELHAGGLDPPSRDRLARLTHETLTELGSAVPDDLLLEFARLIGDGGSSSPSDSELRLIWAQIRGWIAGLAQADQLDELETVVHHLQEAVAAGTTTALEPESSRPVLTNAPTPYL